MSRLKDIARRPYRFLVDEYTSFNLQDSSLHASKPIRFYLVNFRPYKGKQSSKTKEYSIQITSGKTTSVKL